MYLEPKLRLIGLIRLYQDNCCVACDSALAGSVATLSETKLNALNTLGNRCSLHCSTTAVDGENQNNRNITIAKIQYNPNIKHTIFLLYFLLFVTSWQARQKCHRSLVKVERGLLWLPGSGRLDEVQKDYQWNRSYWPHEFLSDCVNMGLSLMSYM